MIHAYVDIAQFLQLLKSTRQNNNLHPPVLGGQATAQFSRSFPHGICFKLFPVHNWSFGCCTAFVLFKTHQPIFNCFRQLYFDHYEFSYHRQPEHAQTFSHCVVVSIPTALLSNNASKNQVTMTTLDSNSRRKPDVFRLVLGVKLLRLLHPRYHAGPTSQALGLDF